MPFKPGQSGNPNGRPKEDPTLRDAARGKTVEALNVLSEIMLDKDQPGSARVTAACAVLDRGHGKPMQMTEVTGKDGESLIVEPLELARRVAFILTEGDEMVKYDA